jgi:hypothetical protein
MFFCFSRFSEFAVPLFNSFATFFKLASAGSRESISHQKYWSCFSLNLQQFEQRVVQGVLEVDSSLIISCFGGYSTPGAIPMKQKTKKLSNKYGMLRDGYCPQFDATPSGIGHRRDGNTNGCWREKANTCISFHRYLDIFFD